jgi:hydroxyethylthiazole kinase-like uncharacterized protein yjeF
MSNAPYTAVNLIELLTTAEMGQADALTIKAGTPGLDLMEAAGAAVADEVRRLSPDAKAVLVLCGPGNNGGDGFVAARLLKVQGVSVRLALLGPIESLKDDAADMAARWEGEVEVLTPGVVNGADLVVDAIFGAGLTREVDGVVAEVIEAVNSSGVRVVSVDVPSGIDGTSGEVRGVAVQAMSTVTFFRAKPGHLLLPGRIHCGNVTIADIGIPASVLDTIAPEHFANTPALWSAHFPVSKAGDHKYSRGHALIISGGPEATGAARLGARGALRVGAGLVTLVGSKAATTINAAQSTAVMVGSFSGPAGLSEILQDVRMNVVLIGPGAGVGKDTRELVMAILKSDVACVLDADALTSFEKNPQALFDAITKRSSPVILTPHEGEYSRLFGQVQSDWPKLARTRKAALLSGGIVLLKGADSVIASPDGRAAINDNAPPWTATAGSGDVLAGFATGLLAQGMPAFEAACAAAWLHGEAADRFGPGLIAEDLSEMLPQILRTLL